MARSRTKNRDEQDERNSEEHEIEDKDEAEAEAEDDDEDDEEEVGEEEEEGEEEELTEYEKQRLRTIERNKAMLAALHLPALASTLAAETSSPVKSRKGKQPQPAAAAATGGPRRRSERVKGGRSAVYDESGSSEKSGSDSEGYSAGSGKRSLQDQEYEPSDEEDEEASQSESEETVHEQEMEEGALHSRNTLSVPDYIDMDEEELALQQALALSLGASPEEAIEQPTSSKKGKNKTNSKKGPKSAEMSPLSSPTDKKKTQAPPPKAERTPVRKRQKMRNDRLQFTTGEIDSFFSLLDEKGSGRLTLADLEIASTLHDFSWSNLELQDMIQFFDSNHDGMLDVADFRSIAVRCNLIRPEG